MAEFDLNPGASCVISGVQRECKVPPEAGNSPVFRPLRWTAEMLADDPIKSRSGWQVYLARMFPDCVEVFLVRRADRRGGIRIPDDANGLSHGALYGAGEVRYGGLPLSNGLDRFEDFSSASALFISDGAMVVFAVEHARRT